MKYQIRCKKCHANIGDFSIWFKQNQRCSCGSTSVEIEYPQPKHIRFEDLGTRHTDFQHLYFDLLPLDSESNIVSCGEGIVPIERWTDLEEYASQHHIDCQVYVYRNDLNGGSGTFKDISAALASSVMKEHGVTDYCLASTGNAGVSFATYLAKAGIRFTGFAPSFIDASSAEAIRDAGQQLHISAGGYGDAKAEAEAFHQNRGVLISGGNTDPLRIESKRTIVFECLRQLGALPTVYLQAVAGGTSPLAFEKGYNDLRKMGYDDIALPRMLLVQQDSCDPMVLSWERAKAEGFPEGWEHDYVVKENMNTSIGILTAARPGNYPLVAPLVRLSGGSFIRVEETRLESYGRHMLEHQNLLMGPASIVCYAGFFEAISQGLIHDGDRVLLNTGEGCQRAPWFKAKVTQP